MADKERIIDVDHDPRVESPQYSYGIPVDGFIKKYEVKDLNVQEILHEFPPLCYLLGRVVPTDIRDSRPDGVDRPVWLAKEGSSMFGLKNPDDAMRWKGIFNHIIGSAGQVLWLGERLQSLTDDQKQRFKERGFDISSLEQLDTTLLRDFMLISHAGRRGMDEKNWYGSDTASPSQDMGNPTKNLLIQLGADSRFIDLMRTELLEDLSEMGKDGMFSSFVVNLLTYCDWTYSQEPVSLKKRFDGMRESKRLPDEIISILEKAGNTFEQALIDIVDPNIFETMRNRPLYKWEYDIRYAYAKGAQMSLPQVFPSFAKAWVNQVSRQMN